MARSLKLAQQNLLVIGIALAFQIVFVVVLLRALGDLEQQYERESHLRVVMGSINGLLNQILATASSEGMYQATQNKPFRKLFLNGYAESVRQGEALKKMLAADKTRDEDLDQLRNLLDEINLGFSQGSKAMDSGEFKDMVQAFKQVRVMIEKAQIVSSSSVHRMEMENARNEDIQKRSKLFILAVIAIGFPLNFLVFLFLLKYLNNMNQKRFDVLASNINALSMERPLQARLVGEDEVAHLDQLLHHVNANLQQAKKKEQAMIENALDLICSLDRNLRFERANSAASKIFMLDMEAIIGKSLTSLVLPEDREKTVRALESVTAGSSEISFENRIKLPDGSCRDMLWSVVYSGEEANLFCVAHDISGRKEVERLKQEVIAVVSHDLRAPLTSLGLTLNILAEGGMGPLSEKAQDRISRAEASVAQLVSIINDLIDIEKYESGVIDMEYKLHGAARLITDAINAVEGTAAAKNITLLRDGADSTVQINCDGVRLVRVLTNLLSNAIKFSESGSKVKVSCQAISTGTVFAVEDQGRGIPPDKLAVIFQRWKQVESEDERQKGGSGLGLAICKALIDAHGGTIEAHSEQGRGSIFKIFIPTNPPKLNG